MINYLKKCQKSNRTLEVSWQQTYLEKKKNLVCWWRALKCVLLVQDCSPCVFVSPPLLRGCWYVGLLLLKNTSQNSIKEKTEERSGRTKWGRHQRPILSTVSTCCNILVATADKPLYKQPVQILPAGCTYSKAFCSSGFVYWSAAWTAGQLEGGKRWVESE